MGIGKAPKVIKPIDYPKIDRNKIYEKKLE